MANAYVSEAILLNSGTLIGVSFKNSTGTLVNVSSVPTAAIVVAINPDGNTQNECGMATTYPVDPSVIVWDTSVPTIYIPLQAQVGATCTLSISIANSSINTTAGYVIGGSFAVTNKAGADLDVVNSSDITMAVGQNAPSLYYANVAPTYTNIAKQMNKWSPPGGTTTLPTLTADGDLSGTPAYTVTKIYRSDLDNGATDKAGYPALPSGVYEFEYDITSSQTTILDGNITPNLKQTYSVKAPLAILSSRFYLDTRISTNSVMTNIRVWPPGVDRTKKFSQQFIDKISNSTCIRFMDTWGINSCTITSRDSIHKLTSSTYTPGRTPNITGNIIAIDAHDNADGYFWVSNGWTYIKFTTATPHGLQDGMQVGLAGLPNPYLTNKGYLQGYTNTTHFCHVLSPTTFAMMSFLGYSSDTVLLPVTGVTGASFSAQIPSTMPLEDMVELCNTTNQDMWWVVPTLYDNASALADAQYIAANLNAGLKCRVEYGNEHWNNGSAFGTYFYVRGKGSLLSPQLTYSQYYAKRAAEIHSVVAPALGDKLVRVFGSWHNGPSTTQTIVDYCTANSIQVDEVAIAPYWHAIPNTVASVVLIANLTNEQLMDMTEFHVHLRIMTPNANNHKSILTAAFPNAKLVCYEGGPENGTYGRTSTSGNMTSQMWIRHPRMWKIFRAWLKTLQDYGISLYVDYTCLGGQKASQVWGRYIGYNQKRGRGDGSNGGFDNRTNFYDLNNIEAVVADSAATWHASWLANRAT